MVVGESKRAANIMDGIENTGDVRMHDHRLRLKQRFDIVRKLGQGTYGKVQLGINKKTGQEVAIKTIKKCKIESEADLIRIRREVQIMSSVRHPNIVHIYEVFENSEKMILVMEYCSGGELYDYLSQKKVLQEDEARSFRPPYSSDFVHAFTRYSNLPLPESNSAISSSLFRQIATAVYYCHIHKICHRDLKLENVLLDDTGSAKIADFGLSNVFKETSLLSTFCGSPLYASPEIVKGTPYIGPEVDCWSLGVLLYTLVYGAMPFDGSNFKRLVRQISNGDYYEPRNPSSASPLIRDMLTVDPLKRADIAYICDHSWVNSGCETSCLEMAEALAAETPVRLDLLLSLAPAAPSHSNSVVVPPETELGVEESTDLTSSASMAIEPSNSAEKRILELVAEGGEDAIKPSPTRTIVSCGDNKRKLELAMSASGLQRKKERAASASLATSQPALPEEAATEILPPEETFPATDVDTQPSLKSSATMTISPAPVELAKDSTKVLVCDQPVEENQAGAKPRVVKKTSTAKALDDTPKSEKIEVKDDTKTSNVVANAAEKLTSLSIAQAPAANQAPAKPKKLSIPGGNVGSFKDQFERRASMTSTPEIKRNISKPVVSKLTKPKAQSEDRELAAKSPDNGTVRLQQIGIEPSPTPVEEEPNRGGVKKTESEPTHGTKAVDPSVLLQDARRSLQNSMAKLVEEKAGEESRRRAARDVISSAIRTGKPPVPYGRSSSAGVAALVSPPGTPPLPPTTAPPRVFRTEAQHRIEDHRNRGVSVERIIPIHMTQEETPTSPPPQPPPQTKVMPTPAPRPAQHTQPPLGRLASTESNASETCASPGEPIKKSAREFIIPIAVEGKGYVTPRQRSLEPDTQPTTRHTRTIKPRRLSSLVSGGESEEEEEAHMHRLRPSRAARADSVSSGEEDEEDEGFHLLTAENLFSTLLHRVRALTQRLNGEEGPGFPQHAHSLFNNMQSPFFNSPHLPRRHLLREGWGSRDLHADLDSMFSKARPHMPRGSSKKCSKNKTKSEDSKDGAGPATEESALDLSDLDLSSIAFSEREMRALSGLTPALSRRLQKQLLAHLPPHAARTLRRTLSLHNDERRPKDKDGFVRSHSATKTLQTDSPDPAPPAPDADISKKETPPSESPDTAATERTPTSEPVSPQYSTLPRLRRRSSPRESTPPILAAVDAECLPLAETSGRFRVTADRSLLSKYLTPEKHLSLDEPYISDGGSILSEPSYVAAYGAPGAGAGGLALRRHSLRLTGEQPKKRFSRFLRSDFFDSSNDENLYAKHKKEKELETQKILREIREKRSRVLETSTMKSPDVVESPVTKDETGTRKCLSPVGIPAARERSRSNTPFFPILDNIKETNLDTPLSTAALKSSLNYDNSKNKSSRLEDNSINRETRLVRPKSYPVKTLDSIEEPSEHVMSDNLLIKEDEKDKSLPRESKLIRPKSYPASSPSPEKVHVKPNLLKKPESINAVKKEEIPNSNIKSDVEVSFSITLPKKNKIDITSKTDTVKLSDLTQVVEKDGESDKKTSENSLVLKKYKVVNKNDDKEKIPDKKLDNGKPLANGGPSSEATLPNNEEVKIKVKTQTSKSKDDVKTKSTEQDIEKKGTIKKKIIKKVSSKSKTDLGSSTESTDAKTTSEKKKVIKKVKEKTADDTATKTTAVTKKKSVLQSIGHKLEKLAASKSSSPEKSVDLGSESKKDTSKLNRLQREQSVPVSIDPPTTESNLIKRAVTLTDVAALENSNTNQNKTTVSKVLGLFKKFEPKEKPKPNFQKSQSENLEDNLEARATEPVVDTSLDSADKNKPCRPTSLLLNGLGRKSKNTKNSSESVPASIESEEQTVLKKDSDTKNLRNSLKLDLSRLPRVKKIVPTNPVIEPQIMNVSVEDNESEKKENRDKNCIVLDGASNVEKVDSYSRSRSRSRSTVSNSDINSTEIKRTDKNPTSPSDISTTHPLRNQETTSPEKEDLIDRIRRKSFYSRFNEKKQRRKSSLVGPGAAEYDPLARIHAPPAEPRLDASPTSPLSYDLSPGLSASSDLSPSTERYRSLLADLPLTTRNSLRFDNYGLNDKVDTYRSLDRNDFRKYPGNRSYLDYDRSPSYGAQRYSRTRSLLESPDSAEDGSLTPTYREPHKYNRTISMYSPGNYATYRPKRTRNSAIILKESEKEPSPENILEKIKQRKKISISVTRKPDLEKDTPPRSPFPLKGEGDGAECPEKVD